MKVSTKALGSLIQSVIQSSKLKMISICFLALLAMLLAFSCNKSMEDMPREVNAEVTAQNQTAPSRMNSNLVAVPFEETFFVPCANNGVGENVALTGATNFVYQMNWNDRGFSLVYHTNSYGITGVGLSTNEMFLGSLGTKGSVSGSWVNSQWVGTTIERMRIIGQHTTYMVKYKYQLVVTPDGKVAVSTSDKTIDCLDK